MYIGILALIIGTIFTAVSFIGIGKVEHPAQMERKINFPYPEEL